MGQGTEVIFANSSTEEEVVTRAEILFANLPFTIADNFLCLALVMLSDS